MTGGDGLFLGVDVGTSATRVSLVRPDASAVTASAVTASAVTASAGYRTVRGGGGQAEQDPAAWSRALATYLAAGAHAVCLGGALTDREAARRGDADGLLTPVPAVTQLTGNAGSM